MSKNTDTEQPLTEVIARKVLETVDHGLVSGIGVAKPGQMCVEAAVCYAYGLPHSDNPPCVSPAVRAFKIALNDRGWSSTAARAAGLRRVAIAQLGSEGINDVEFVTKLVINIIKGPLANLFTKLGIKHTMDGVETLEAANAAAYASGEAAYAAHAAGHAAAYAGDDAAYAARAANAAGHAAGHAAAHAAGHAAAAHAVANAAAHAAHAAGHAAAAYAAANAATYDATLAEFAEVAVGVLTEMSSPGAQFLYLCDK